MTRWTAQALRSLRVQLAILEALRDCGALTAREIADELRRRAPALHLALGIQGYAVAGHLRELARDYLVEKVERSDAPTRWDLVEEHCAGLLG